MSKHVDASARRYEMMFIIQPNATEAKRKAALKEIQGYIAEAGGKIFHEDDWGLRDLAYRIKGFDSGYYVIYYFEGAKPEMLKELDQNMRLNQDVVRHLTTTLAPGYEIVQYNPDEEEEDEIDKELKEKPAPKRRSAVAKPKADEAKEEKKAEKVDEKELDKKLDEIMQDDDLGL